MTTILIGSQVTYTPDRRSGRCRPGLRSGGIYRVVSMGLDWVVIAGRSGIGHRVGLGEVAPIPD